MKARVLFTVAFAPEDGLMIRWKAMLHGGVVYGFTLEETIDRGKDMWSPQRICVIEASR